eukprot:Skav229797  [mRNA]  locus=scaffold567:75731:76228:- [translate_table: standard]
MVQASYNALLAMDPQLVQIAAFELESTKETCLFAQQFFPENKHRNAALAKVCCLLALIRNKCENPDYIFEDTVWTSKYDTYCQIQSVQETVSTHLGLNSPELLEAKIAEVKAAKNFLVKIMHRTDKNLFHQGFVQGAACTLYDLQVHLEHRQGEGQQGQGYKHGP